MYKYILRKWKSSLKSRIERKSNYSYGERTNIRLNIRPSYIIFISWLLCSGTQMRQCV